jgi:hypothetical protein
VYLQWYLSPLVQSGRVLKNKSWSGFQMMKIIFLRSKAEIVGSIKADLDGFKD